MNPTEAAILFLVGLAGFWLLWLLGHWHYALGIVGDCERSLAGTVLGRSRDRS